MNAPVAALRRKALHLATGALPVAWSVGLVETSDVQRLLGVAAALAIAVELVRRHSTAARATFDRLFGPMLKPHEARALTGATWLVFAMLVAALLFPPGAARAALWAGAVGDAAAAIVGGAWGRRTRRPGKSVAGSLTCAAATTLGALWLGGFALPAAVGLGLLGAAVEWPAHLGDDNARVTLVVGAAASVLVRG